MGHTPERVVIKRGSNRVVKGGIDGNDKSTNHGK